MYLEQVNIKKKKIIIIKKVIITINLREINWKFWISWTSVN